MIQKAINNGVRGLKVNNSVEGETIETKIVRIVENKEPIKDGCARIYTERKDGVLAGHNIRTDRWDVAIDTMDKVHKSDIAKRSNNVQDLGVKGGENDGKTEPIQGTE